MCIVPTDGFLRAGAIGYTKFNLIPEPPKANRKRNPYGNGPFAKLKMPLTTIEPGVYLWEEDGRIVYVGQTRKPLMARLGSGGYSSISLYNTYAPKPGLRNGGQETNCRINSSANLSITSGHSLIIWYKVTAAELAKREETAWMQLFEKPFWNLKDER